MSAARTVTEHCASDLARLEAVAAVTRLGAHITRMRTLHRPYDWGRDDPDMVLPTGSGADTYTQADPDGIQRPVRLVRP